jgi:hypothetical protein
VRIPVAIILALCLALLGVGLATAEPFRITFQRERDEPSSIVLMGEVFNDGVRDVVDVWITADARNAEPSSHRSSAGAEPPRSRSNSPAWSRLSHSASLSRRFDMHPRSNPREDLAGRSSADLPIEQSG